ncbi:MAG: hypothetical protein II007_13340 [Gammaproteobacteria bacterium]|nr:hypothetical protein [Gammaproteobacteria bacterium]
MAGLLKQQAGRQPQPMPQQPDDEGEAATPEEEGERQELLMMAATMIHGEQTSDKIYQVLENSQDPIQGIAMAAATVMVRLEMEVGEISDAVKFQLGEDITGELVDLALAGGLVTEEQLTDEAGNRLAALSVQYYTKMREQAGRPFTQEEAAGVLEKNKDTKYGQGINAMSNDEAAEAKEIMALMQQAGG